MWCLVMFDLPTKTKRERRDASQFRNYLLDHGFLPTQFSVYRRYSPTLWGNTQIIKGVKENIPPKGDVEIINLSGRQWQAGHHTCNGREEKTPAPGLLTLF